MEASRKIEKETQGQANGQDPKTTPDGKGLSKILEAWGEEMNVERRMTELGNLATVEKRYLCFRKTPGRFKIPEVIL